MNDRIGHLAGDAVLAEAAERVRDVTRSADIACRVGGDEFAVILPEASHGDADHFTSASRTPIAARPLGQAGSLRFSAGVAELQASDDAVSFFQRADDALYRAKELGKGRISAAPGLVARSRRRSGRDKRGSGRATKVLGRLASAGERRRRGRGGSWGNMVPSRQPPSARKGR